MTEVSRIVPEDEDRPEPSWKKKVWLKVRGFAGEISAGIVSSLGRVWAEISDPRDWHTYGGLALIAYGCWILKPAVGFITLGVGLILITVIYGGTKREGSN